jgi:osmoprotectant transport system permease protein
MARRAPVTYLAAGLCAVGLASAAPAQEPLVVGSKNFGESTLLGEVLSQWLAADLGLEVEHRAGLGGTLLLFEALRAGEIDLYPEYTGTGWAVVLGEQDQISDPLRAYLTVQEQFRRRFDLEWLAPFGFENSYALAVTADTAERLALRSISDLAARGSGLRAGFSVEFHQRDDGWPGLARHYGLELASVSTLEHGLAYDALAAGAVDLIDIYTTDGKLVGRELRTLIDDRRFFPPYTAAPVVRREVLAAEPRLAPSLARLAYLLPEERMRELNRRLEVDGEEAAEVARDFLGQSGLLSPAPAAAAERGRGNFFAFLAGRGAVTLHLAGQHLWLCALAIGLACAVAVPAGIALARGRWGSTLALGAAGILQTVPSLALLAFMIAVPGLGLTARSAVAALFLYALLPVLRNTITGLRAIDPLWLDAARGMGLTEAQILFRIQLPLALPTIMAGVRTAAVISVGVATLAAFIGAGGLGEPIVTGLYLNDTWLILAGALPAAGLALLVDLGLGRLERRLTPLGIRNGAR